MGWDVSCRIYRPLLVLEELVIMPVFDVTTADFISLSDMSQ
jgi:hypothetical protein